MAWQDWLEKLHAMPMADTHEHLVEEDSRNIHGPAWQARDFSVFFAQYPESDLRSSGMSDHDADLLLKPDVDPQTKWNLVREPWKKIKYTGYGLLIRESLKQLYGIDDLTDENWKEINGLVSADRQAGWYHRLIKDVAKIDHMHVNSLEDLTYQETLYPEYMLQDLSFLHLSVSLPMRQMEERHNVSLSSLKDMELLIDKVFDLYGHRAVAMKNQGAYLRKLDYSPTTREEGDRVFERFAKSGFSMSHEDRKPLEDYLFDYCVRKGIDYSLPIKLHTGYYAGHGGMPLSRVGDNPKDCAELCRRYPEAKFVFMHCMYPYMDELISLTKHFRNAFADMCWMWIISPKASIRFLEEILMTSPVNKVFLFGGDHCQVELIPGHAEIARKGLSISLQNLCDQGWLNSNQANDVAEKLMLGNAYDLYDIERCRKNNPARERGL